MIRLATILSLSIVLAVPTLVHADAPRPPALSQSLATIRPGDSLEIVLDRAGIAPAIPAEAALALAGVFDLTDLLAGQVDFRRDLQGGATFALIWLEDQLPGGGISGEPRLG
ncbi:MAG TPA: hypothetical protein PLI43_16080 [Albidovulum sp.]|uniref:hypothetical protein n=1 Tax=Albidovulum sp. TaxID=1872424 RepID=UPI002C30E8A4|nr:hypothetical protein [Albidovulum sp.]